MFPDQTANFTTANSGSFQWVSPDAPLYGFPKQHFWLITVSENLVILLNLTHLIMPDCNKNLLQVNDGYNIASPVLTRFCGSNASSGGLVLSSSNSLFIVLNSRNYLERLGSTLQFHATYVAQLKTGTVRKVSIQ